MLSKGSMDIITKDDLNDIINNKDSLIYESIRNNKDTDTIKDDIYSEILQKYDLIDKNDDLSASKKLYYKSYVRDMIHKKIIDYKNRIENRKDILEKLEKLKRLVLPEQRSEEWYKIRESILTASSLADAIGEGHFCNKDQLLIQKCGGPRGEVPFNIVEWGVMYEPVATTFYEKLNIWCFP